MSKTLKYSQLIDSQNVNISCPGADALARITDAFRWCTDPVSNPINYLPNIKEDEMRGRPPRLLKGDLEKCGRCAISFFDNITQAKNKFNSIPLPMRLKLGYTHIATGVIDINDGLLTPTLNNHFMLFEYEGVELSVKFQTAGSL